MYVTGLVITTTAYYLQRSVFFLYFCDPKLLRMKHLLLRSATFLFFTFMAAAPIRSQVTLNASPNNGCSPLNVNLTASAPGAVFYSWDFGDNSPMVFNSSASMVHTYYVGPWQTMTARVEAFDGAMSYLGTAWSQPIQVNGAADSLSTTNYSPCPGDIIVLDIWPSQNANVLSWDFDDGNITNGNYYGIQHSYAAPGVYNPSATIQTPCGITTIYQTINVTTSGGFPQNLWFNAQRDSICPGDKQTFYIMDWAYPNYVINFGDGNYISTTNQHVYPNTGTYITSVTYTNGCGNTITAYDTIYVVNSLQITTPPYISMYSDPSCTNTKVQFYASPDVFSTYSWNFGNGDTTSNPTPERMFPSVGNYPIQLIVWNGCGFNSAAVDTLNIVNNIPVSGYSMDIRNDSICAGDAVFCNINGGNGGEVAFSWDFGDGNTLVGPGENASHVYTANGTYTITVTVANGCGNTQVITQIAYVGNNVVPNPSEYIYGPVPFGQGVVTQCVGDSVLFVFAPMGGGGTVSWDFGDLTSGVATGELFVDGVIYRYIKHGYQAPGLYTATVTYTNSCGNTFTDTRQVNITTNFSGIEAEILVNESQYHCQGKPIAFYAIGGSTYIWNFGDGTGNFISYSTLSPIYHAYANAGQYTVSCKVINGCGYSDVDSTMIVIPPSKINITTNTVSSNCLMNDGKAIAVVEGGELPYSYQWSNGNSTFLADSLTSGIYVVTVTDAHGCSNFAIATVSDMQAPVITVSAVVDVSCYGGVSGAIDINLIGNSAPYTYIWSNGSTSQDVYQLVAGPYEVIVTDVNGCVSTRSILVEEPPQVILSTITTPASCGNNDGTGAVAVSGSTGPYGYIWPDGGNTPAEYSLGAGIYNVTVVDNNGCIYDTDVTINEVNGPLIVQDSITGTGCGSNLASIYIHPVNGTGPFTYSWSNGATTQDLLNVLTGSYTVTVTGNDGCRSLKDFQIVKDEPGGTSVCIVTVDTITGMNRIVIVKDTSLANISGYNIYKESTMSGLYYQVGTIPFSSQAAAWTDSLSDSKVRSWRYKVTVVDNCGGESEMSSEHKTIHLNTNAGINNSYNLIWDHYEGLSFSTYAIYRYDQANGWVFLNNVPNNIMSYTDLNPPTNTLAYMVDAVVNSGCSDSTARYSDPGLFAAINNSHSNIKNLLTGPSGVDHTLPFGPEFTLYPNPGNGIINIAYPFSASGYTVNVSNSIGQVMYRLVIPAGESLLSTNVRSIDLSGFAKGVYTVSFESVNGRIHKKLILQ
jgi:PKD repeat protein